MKRTLGVAAAATALVASATALFGGVAFAGGAHDQGGPGGSASTHCVQLIGNLSLPVLPILPFGNSSDQSNCNATGGAGGAGDNN